MICQNLFFFFFFPDLRMYFSEVFQERHRHKISHAFNVIIIADKVMRILES